MANPSAEYRPGPFNPLSETAQGKELWHLINEDRMVALMAAATDKGQCAVVGIEKPLLECFEMEMADDQVRHMIEHMVDQVMEHKGYEIERRNVTVSSSTFSSGTLHARPGWQRLYVFRSSKDARQLCFAESCDIENLPSVPGGGSWCRDDSFATDLRGHIAYGITNVSNVREEVKNEGYSLRTQERMLRPG